jgi:hypothetical protein
MIVLLMEEALFGMQENKRAGDRHEHRSLHIFGGHPALECFDFSPARRKHGAVSFG